MTAVTIAGDEIIVGVLLRGDAIDLGLALGHPRVRGRIATIGDLHLLIIALVITIKEGLTKTPVGTAVSGLHIYFCQALHA